MYNDTHDTKMFNGCVHINYSVRLILNKGMGVIWNESLYHPGKKTRQSPSGLVKADLRLFMYLWPKVANNKRNRTAGTTDGVA